MYVLKRINLFSQSFGEAPVIFQDVCIFFDKYLDACMLFEKFM